MDIHQRITSALASAAIPAPHSRRNMSPGSGGQQLSNTSGNFSRATTSAATRAAMRSSSALTGNAGAGDGATVGIGTTTALAGVGGRVDLCAALAGARGGWRGFTAAAAASWGVGCVSALPSMLNVVSVVLALGRLVIG